jgi:hypothetical protein
MVAPWADFGGCCSRVGLGWPQPRLRDALSQGRCGGCFSCRARAKPTPQLPAPSRRAALLLLPVARALGRCRGDRRGVGGALSLPPELVVAATVSLTRPQS